MVNVDFCPTRCFRMEITFTTGHFKFTATQESKTRHRSSWFFGRFHNGGVCSSKGATKEVQMFYLQIRVKRPRAQIPPPHSFPQLERTIGGHLTLELAHNHH